MGERKLGCFCCGGGGCCEVGKGWRVIICSVVGQSICFDRGSRRDSLNDDIMFI